MALKEEIIAFLELLEVEIYKSEQLGILERFRLREKKPPNPADLISRCYYQKIK